MTYYSKNKYAQKNDLWYENFCFQRWFSDAEPPILDIGCATGNFVATHPDIIEGIDIDNDSLKIAKKRGLNVHYLDASRELGQLPKEHYGGIFAKQIIEHLDNPLSFMKHIHRLLKPTGKAVLLTPNCPWALNKFFWDDYTHKHPFTAKGLKMLAQDAGFKDIRVETDFRSFLGLGFLFRHFKISPEFVARAQRYLLIKSLALILIVKK